MNIFKKIDSYLLHHHPAIWVTRLHSFLPIGLVLIGAIYLLNSSLGWDPKSNMLDTDASIVFMIIPVLVYLVYWFIFQSRYNVLKSGGKVSIFKEYVSYIMYAIVFFTAYLFILVIPISNDQRMTNAVSLSEVEQDHANLNLGNVFVNDFYGIVKLSEDTYRIENSEYGNYYFSYNSYNEFFYDHPRIETVTKREALQRIENYCSSYNKYTEYEISESPQALLDRVENDDVFYVEDDWIVGQKVSRIIRVYEEGWLHGDFQEIFWKTSLAVIVILALFVWVFKQMNLRYYILGFVSLCLTPIVIVLMGVLFFYVMELRDLEAHVTISTLILLIYIIVGFLAIRGFLQKRLNPTAAVLTMYFHVWLSALPIFIFFFITAILRLQNHDWYYLYWDREELFDLIYWSCITLCLLSIVLFKPIYAKFRSLPAAK